MGAAFARAGWRVTALDAHPTVLAELTRRRTATSMQVVAGDARDLPFEDGAFHVAHSSLLLHHLDPADAVAALREMARVSRLGVIVNDLRRGALAVALAAPPILALSRSAMTRHDGLVSLRRAYTLAELDELLKAAGLRAVWRSNRLMPRVVTSAVSTSV